MGLTMGIISEFNAFMSKGNVVDLAVAVVMGVALNNVITGLVTDIITPLIGIPGHVNYQNLVFTVNGSTLMYGAFINAVINFLVISAVVFLFIVKPVAKLEERRKAGKQTPPTTKTCTECLSTIPINARRCAYCASRQK